MPSYILLLTKMYGIPFSSHITGIWLITSMGLTSAARTQIPLVPFLIALTTSLTPLLNFFYWLMCLDILRILLLSVSFESGVAIGLRQNCYSGYISTLIISIVNLINDQFQFIPLWKFHETEDLFQIVSTKNHSKTFRMEDKVNQQNPQQSLFRPVQQFELDTLQLGQAIFRNTFSLSKRNEQNIKLVITPSHIVKYQLEYLTAQSAVAMDFDLKFQIIYSKEGDLQSEKVGFRLFKNYHQDKIDLFCSNSQSLRLWLVYLSSKINQRGFHSYYKPIQKLGKGNFAAVYQAIRIQDNKSFAVKAFSKMNSFSSKNGKESLALEMSVLRKLNHKNVIRLEGVFQSDNSIYVVIQKLDGGSLLDKIAQKKCLFQPQQIKKMMNGLVKGLRHIHSQRIMHRDLKPQNILLRSKDSLDLVIVDFGLSTFVDVQNYLFFRCGTPGFVAPQVINLKKSEHIQPECDIFSLGVIFHIFLTGKPLFSGETFDKIYMNNRNMEFDLTGKIYKKVDEKAIDLLKKMLVQDPSKRINAHDVLNHEYLVDYQNQLQKQGENCTQIPLRQKKTNCQLFQEDQCC